MRERGCARAGTAPASDTSSGGPGDDGKASNVPDPRSSAGQPWCVAVSDLRVCGARRFAEIRELRSRATRGERTSPGRKSRPGRRGLAARTSVLSSPLRASPCSEGGAPTTARPRVLGARGLHGRREPRRRALRPAPAHTPGGPPVGGPRPGCREEVQVSARLRSGGPCSRTADDLSRLTLTSRSQAVGPAWIRLRRAKCGPRGSCRRGWAGMRWSHALRAACPQRRPPRARGWGQASSEDRPSGQPASFPLLSWPPRAPSPEIPWPRATSTAQDGSDLQLVAWEGAHSTCLPDMFSSLTLKGISPDREQTRIVNGKPAGAAARVPVPWVPLRARWGSVGAAETNSPGLCPPHQLEEAGGDGRVGKRVPEHGPGGAVGLDCLPRSGERSLSSPRGGRPRVLTLHLPGLPGAPWRKAEGVLGQDVLPSDPRGRPCTGLGAEGALDIGTVSVLAS